MKTLKTLTYKELQGDLQRILSALEHDGTSLDEIAQLLKSGFETIDQLRTRLTDSEAQIENIISLRHNTPHNAQIENGEGESQP